MTELHEIGNAGPVQPVTGLAFHSEWVDCPSCQKRQKTNINKVPSEATRYVLTSFILPPQRAPPRDLVANMLRCSEGN